MLVLIWDNRYMEFLSVVNIANCDYKPNILTFSFHDPRTVFQKPTRWRVYKGIVLGCMKDFSNKICSLSKGSKRTVPKHFERSELGKTKALNHKVGNSNSLQGIYCSCNHEKTHAVNLNMPGQINEHYAL